LFVQARTSTSEQSSRTFTEAARRAQIVDATIAVIADLGVARASFAQIARRAGLSSTGLISYYFAGKHELLGAVVAEILGRYTAFVEPQVDAEATVSGILRAFLRSSVAFARAHRAQVLALLAIWDAAPAATDGPLTATAVAEADLAKLEAVLREGQRRGELRAFDPRFMAVAILALRNGVLRRLAADPSLDPDADARELVTLVDLATRKEPS
jgi:AcrR family transcriptional regulator